MSTKPPRLLVVDDDPELRGLLQRFLSEHGFKVRTASSGSEMDRELRREPADLLVLDLMMPGEDGLAITRRLRADGESIPILMLTARGDPVDRVLGLEMGCDDYLAKPFLPRELVARATAILRRMTPSGASVVEEAIAFGPFSLDVTGHRLSRDGAEIALSSREFALLSTLAQAQGRTLSRATLVERAIGRDAEVTDRAIDVAIARLRKAIGDDPANPQWVRTIWGAGYMLATGSE
ncbi:response regulator [Alteraurantiacibacter buctensis]|uniref:Response regulator n=1 Tax=Alteraurantiacibacter buctensis TaxID=1503981 RepID=A0A844Z1S9_9SPHN|nr:response regulator [Alteraurantiacibacter buctensis]MXO71863.1 response regulator [Alteraurantiacibacter buctensis]